MNVLAAAALVTAAATLLSSLCTLLVTIRTRAKAEAVARLVATSNGQTIGQMVEAAEPHHRLLPDGSPTPRYPPLAPEAP